MEVLRESQYLKHGQYGLGVVTQSNAERTTIDFELHGVKKFVTSLLVVELMPGHAPARPAPARRTSKKIKVSAAPRSKSDSK